MRILIALLLITTAAACSKKGSGNSDCDAAVNNGVDKTISKRRAGNPAPMTPEEQEVPKKLKGALAKSCVDDKWSADVIACFKTADDIATCKDKLTPEQRAAYSRAAMGVMMGSKGGAGGPMPPHGMGGSMPPADPSTTPPPSGSADGSAAPPAGSAMTPPAAGSN